MMRIVFALIALFLASLASAETRLFTGQSDRDLALDVTYDGKEILFYGAIDSDEDAPFDVIVTAQGPLENLKIARKTSRFGLWINDAVKSFEGIPSYLAIMSTAPLAEIADNALREEMRLGLFQELRSHGYNPANDFFLLGLARAKARAGQFVIDEAGIELKGNILFSGSIPLPANIRDGQYQVEIHLLQDGKLAAHSASTIDVAVVGLDRWLSDLAHNYGLLYGLLSVFLAIGTSFFASHLVGLIRG